MSTQESTERHVVVHADTATAIRYWRFLDRRPRLFEKQRCLDVRIIGGRDVLA
jgi:hypothetical protein